MIREAVTTAPVELIFPNEDVRLTSIEDLKDHLLKRQTYFLNALRRYGANGDYFSGLQSVRRDSLTNRIKKVIWIGASIIKPEQPALHTGLEQCFFAAYSMGVA